MGYSPHGQSTPFLPTSVRFGFSMPGSTQLRPVWLASYPRSGNTFLRILLQNVFHIATYSLYRVQGQEFPDPSAEALDEAPYLPCDWEQRVSSASDAKLTLIKTHDAPRDGAPAIYLVRDGRAAIDSYYHYHQKFAFEKPSLTDVIAGACQFGGWSDHYHGWQPRSRPNTLFLQYEDLVTQPAKVIPQIADFLHLSPGNGELPSFAELQGKFPAFFRRGLTDAFLRDWTADQFALFNACHGALSEELGYRQIPGSAAGSDLLLQLANSGARLHHLYVEQLSRLGAAAASQQCLAKQVQQLAVQIQDLSSELQDTQAALNFLLSRKWVKLGKGLRLLDPQAYRHGTPHAGNPAATRAKLSPELIVEGRRQGCS